MKCDQQAVLAAEVREIAAWVQSQSQSPAVATEPLALPPQEIIQQLGALSAYYMQLLPLLGPLVVAISVGATMFEAGVRYGKTLAALGGNEGAGD
jgi:hypothetical protein